MERIEIHSRTTKEKGAIKLRFRLTDGRKVQLFHKSDIIADLDDLSKLNKDGTYIAGLRKRTQNLIKLQEGVSNEIAAMMRAYDVMKNRGIEARSDLFEQLVYDELHPEIAAVKTSGTLLERLQLYIDDSMAAGLWGASRNSFYNLLHKEMQRHLTIIGRLGIGPQDLTANDLIGFRNFLFDEYKYVDKWKRLYEDEPERMIPKKRRGQNTVATRMKQLRAFYGHLEDCDEIQKSPFRKMGKERSKITMRERYDDPVFLHYDEFKKVFKANVPDTLAETRDAFVLQCSFGCRVGDFKKLSMANISVDPNGIPYIHYLPDKTKKIYTTEVETPIVRFALDIIKRTNFKFAILKYVTGKSGYNAKIRKLLEHCGIDRKCTVFNEEKNDNEYIPLYKLGNTKLCRKTHVDIMNKAQVNRYAAGLHRIGSNAVDRYTMLELKDKFKLMCYAFGQKEYKVDKDLNVIK
ncbi:MAG: hypothetical protein K5920_00905 [Bacteroidales bacterium]|nr:hypothetical protein [Bacteroidales bacterium]